MDIGQTDRQADRRWYDDTNSRSPRSVRSDKNVAYTQLYSSNDSTK